MKKALASALVTASYFSFAIPAFAQNLNPCATADDTTGFSNLCKLSAEGSGATIYAIIIAILIISAIVALFYLIWGGFKWITSGGDKTKVQGARDTIVAAIVGLILAFLAFFILSVVLRFFNIGFENFNIPILNNSSGGPSQDGSAPLPPQQDCEPWRQGCPI